MKISDAEYFAHLLRYKDGRFARDKKFIFVSFNFLLRKQAKKLTKTCMYVNQFTVDDNVEEVLETENEKKKFVSACCRVAKTLTGIVLPPI